MAWLIESIVVTPDPGHQQRSIGQRRQQIGVGGNQQRRAVQKNPSKRVPQTVDQPPDLLQSAAAPVDSITACPAGMTNRLLLADSSQGVVKIGLPE